MSEATQQPGYQFRIVHLMYVVAMMSASVACFGMWGFLVGAVICGYWAWSWINGKIPLTCVEHLVVIALIGILLGLFLPSVEQPRESARVAQCSFNLHLISSSLNNYEADYGSFPPAYITDDNGTPMHSWRVLILPYLEEDQLYEKYNFDEPWDGPNNRKLLDEMPEVYRCPSATHATKADELCTNYLAVIGPNTMWPGETPRRPVEVTDEIENTVSVIEFNDTKIPWMKPGDIQYDKAIQLLSSDDPIKSRLVHQHIDCRNIAMPDGSVRRFSSGQSKEFWQAIIGINDGIDWGPLEYNYNYSQSSPQAGEFLLRFSIFLILMILPWFFLDGERNEW